MHSTVRLCLAMSLLAASACTTASGTPATTPTNSAPVTIATTGSVVATTTTTTLATTTTVDRLTEIAAIFEDLERRRLQAIFDHDEEAFRAVHANEEYLQESLIVLELAHVINPTADFHQDAISIVADNSACIAAELARDYTGVLTNGATGTRTYVAQHVGGTWGLSWVGEGWPCDGPHPLSP